MKDWSTAGGYKGLMDPGKGENSLFVLLQDSLLTCSVVQCLCSDLGEFVSRMGSGSDWKLLLAWDTLTSKSKFCKKYAGKKLQQHF